MGFQGALAGSQEASEPGHPFPRTHSLSQLNDTNSTALREFRTLPSITRAVSTRVWILRASLTEAGGRGPRHHRRRCGAGKPSTTE